MIIFSWYIFGLGSGFEIMEKKENKGNKSKKNCLD